MALDAWFRAAATGTGRRELTEITYRADDGGLLEVAHDLEALRSLRDGAGWRALWDQRWRATAHPFDSGVWAKKDLVLPNLPDADIVSLGEGCSTLQPARRLGAAWGLDRLFIKQCGTSHTGSFKDLGMTVLVSQVNHIIRRGAPILGVACASTGDTSAALAAYCAAAGIPAVVLVPAGKISPAQLVQPMSHDALTLELETDFDGCMRVVQQITEDRKLYLANSMNSLRIEGQKTVAIEIVQQLGWTVPDWIFIPGGNLGNVSALYKGLEEIRALGVIDRLPSIVCCQAEAANPLYRAFRSGWRDFAPITAQPTQASAIRIGDPVSAPKAIAALRRHGGLVEQASEGELAEACAMADACGMFACPHTGVALAAVRTFAQRGEIRKDQTVVVVSTAHGLKFGNVKTDYHLGTIPGVTSQRPNRPVRLAANAQAIYDAVMRHVERR